MKRPILLRDSRGTSAVEFALLAPVLVSFVVGAAQLGILFMANAGLSNAVAEGARLASIFPRPSDTAILNRVGVKKFGLNPEYLTGPSIRHGSDASGRTYADVTMSYSVPLDFILFEVPPVRLSETRRVFTQPTS